MLDELFEIDLSIVIEVDLADHLIELFTRTFLVHYQVVDLALIDQSVHIRVEQSECFLQLLVVEVAGNFSCESDELAEGYPS